MEEQFTFHGKNALVLGIGGMGKKIINELFEHGIHAVFAGDKSDENLSDFDAPEGSGLYRKKIDLSKVSERKDFLKWLKAFTLPIHIFIHSAGILGKLGYFHTLTHKERDLVYRVNSDSFQWFLSECINSFFIPQRFGRVIVITSIAGFIEGEGAAAYDASKAHMTACMRGLMKEWEGNREFQEQKIDIRGNVIAPRMVRTGMTAHIEKKDKIRELQFKRFKQDSFSDPAHIANRVIELLECNAHGRIIDERNQDLHELFFKEPYKKLIHVM